MRIFTLIILLSVYYICSYAQQNTETKIDTLRMLKTFKFNSFQQSEKKTIMSLESSLNFKNSTRYTLYHDTLNTKCILYDNYRHEYFNIEHQYRYTDIGSLLVGGTVYTLMDLLFRKR